MSHTSINISVIVCTHNPRYDYLKRVLAALRAQQFPSSGWELIIVDNASLKPVVDQFDISWHPMARVVREMELGLTPARLRGISEARGDFFVFVDDDNVISSTYLASALKISLDHPFLGAWGGSIAVEYEQAPPPWVRQFESHFAFRQFSKTRWSNVKDDIESQPYGAGMCVRREVCKKYATAISMDVGRRSLDRKGQGLLAGGDLDLVLTANEIGLGFGNFPELTLIHLIPLRRFEKPYMLRLRENVTASNAVVALLHGFYSPPIPAWRFWIRWIGVYLASGRHAADFLRAERRGLALGMKMWQALDLQGSIQPKSERN